MNAPAAFDLAVTTLAPGELSDRDRADWAALAASHEDYDSPLLTPDFAVAVARACEDVCVTLVRRGEALIAAWAYHRRPGGFARPVGVPFADYAGPLLAPRSGLTLETLAGLAGVSAYRCSNFVDPHALEAGEETDLAHSFVIRRGKDDAETYLEARRKEHAKRFKNFRRLRRQMESEGHEVTLRWGTAAGDVLRPLLDFKSAQLRESGLTDLTQTRRSRRILDAMAEDAHGFSVSLWSGDTLVAGHFGFRTDARFHAWIASYNPDFAQWSPGNIFLMEIIRHLEEMGLETYDLAGGHDHYKKYFTNASRPSRAVFAAGRGMGGRMHAAREQVWQTLSGGRSDSLPARLQRRMDQIAVCESSNMLRAREFIRAVSHGGSTQTGGHAAQSR